MLHPNILMYKLIIQIEILFRKYYHVGRNAFDFILKDLTSSKINIQFSCKDHVNNSVEIVAYVIQFYLQIRFREFLKDEIAEIKKISRLKKKKPSFARLECI